MVGVHVKDSGVELTVTIGRFTGTDPRSGTTHDEPDISVTAGPPAAPAGRISGNAAPLLLALWKRANWDDVEQTGDPAVLASLRSILSAPLN